MAQADKSPGCQVWQPEFKPQNPEWRTLTPASCLLISTYTQKNIPQHTSTQKMNKKTNGKIYQTKTWN